MSGKGETRLPSIPRLERRECRRDEAVRHGAGAAGHEARVVYNEQLGAGVSNSMKGWAQPALGSGRACERARSRVAGLAPVRALARAASTSCSAAPAGLFSLLPLTLSPSPTHSHLP